MRTATLLLLAALPACVTAPAARSVPPPARDAAPPAPVDLDEPEEHTGSDHGDTVPTAGTPTSPTDLGRVHAESLALATGAKGVAKIELEVDATGRVTKIAVYHRDPDQIPAPVRELAATRFAGAKLRYYETERELDGGLVYEVEVDPPGKALPCEVEATANGNLLSEECQVATRDLPAPVRDTIRATISGKIAKVERVREGDGEGAKEHYSAKVRVGDLQHAIEVAPDGKLLGHEIIIPAEVELPAP